MNFIQTLLEHPAVQSVGWGLIHFVWQGIFISLLVACGLVLLRHRSASVKYLVCCCGLALMAVAPVITSLMLLFPKGIDDRAVRPEVVSAASEPAPAVTEPVVEQEAVAEGSATTKNEPVVGRTAPRNM